MAPLADAMQPILERLSEVGDGDGDATGGRSPLVDPADVLSLVLDLTGSLELEAHLSSGDSVPAAAEQGDEPGAEALSLEELEAALADRFTRLERSVQRRMAELPSGRSRLPDAERLHAELAGRGALRRRNPRVIGAIARETCEMYVVVVSNLLDRARSESRLIRSDMEPRIAGLGPFASELVGIDARVCRATYRFGNRLFSRIPAALARDWELRLLDAVRALPEDVSEADLQPWYGASGWVGEFHRNATRLLMAAVAHEWRALAGLLEAVAAGGGGEADGG